MDGEVAKICLIVVHVTIKLMYSGTEKVRTEK